jgi:hypothetical protein
MQVLLRPIPSLGHCANTEKPGAATLAVLDENMNLLDAVAFYVHTEVPGRHPPFLRGE